MADQHYFEQEKRMSARSYQGNEMKYLSEVLAVGQLSSLMGGTFVPRFEREFARTIGAKHSIAMNSCMSALHAAVLCAGAREGSEVICDAEFIFGAMAVLYSNAIPVFVDIDPVTHNMNPDRIEAAITERTKAIIVTHAWGLPAEIDRIVQIGHRHNLVVIEDCAESLMADFNGRVTGSIGDIGCFSFQASKQLSLGDGGMATTSSEDFLKKLANHAGAPTWHSVAYGLDYNYRMNEPTAAVGLAQLEVLPESIMQLRKNASYYDQAVKNCDWLVLQRGPSASNHSFYHWAATFNGEERGLSMAEFKKAVKDEGIQSISFGYTNVPSYMHPVVREKRAHAYHCDLNKGYLDTCFEGSCPIAEKVIPNLMIAYVVAAEDVAAEEAEKLNKVIGKLGR